MSSYLGGRSCRSALGGKGGACSSRDAAAVAAGVVCGVICCLLPPRTSPGLIFSSRHMMVIIIHNKSKTATIVAVIPFKNSELQLHSGQLWCVV